MNAEPSGDIIASKRAAPGRATGRCWTSWRKRCVKRAARPNHRETALEALRKESDRALMDLIRRRLALPMAKRMNFLRVRLPGGGSHL
jgi:hypothetical protein